MQTLAPARQRCELPSGSLTGFFEGVELRPQLFQRHGIGSVHLLVLLPLALGLRECGGPGVDFGFRVAAGFLLAAAVGLAMAAMFDMKHDLHGLAAMIGIPSLPIAAALISS